MEVINQIVGALNGVLWGPVMLVLIGGTGFFLMAGLSMMPILKLTLGFRRLFEGRKDRGHGDITPFNALMTSLAATVGTGNIAGVATAIVMGGPGALFWMWCTAFLGMATKFAEALLAVKYREVDDEGLHVGGPMYYIKNGLGPKWAWLGVTFAFCGAMAGFGIGNMVQSNSVADVLASSYGVPKLASGLGMGILVALVLIGGIKRIGEVAGKLVPTMAILYLFGGIVVIFMQLDRLPEVLSLVFTHAFTPHAAVGGFAGSTLWMAMRFGVARGVFSNEAGLGSAPIAHASAAVEHPVDQGLVAMLGTFIDTLVICSITGIVILLSGEWTSGLNGASLSSAAFEKVLPGAGGNIVGLGLALFAFSTIIGWSHYGERCVQFLFGRRAILPFRVLWCIAVPLGAIAKLDFIWLLADTLNAMMALPNLIALLLLSPVVFQLSRSYFSKS